MKYSDFPSGDVLVNPNLLPKRQAEEARKEEEQAPVTLAEVFSDAERAAAPEVSGEGEGEGEGPGGDRAA